MNWRRYFVTGILGLFCAATMFVLTGCATTESENASSRPWNNPRGWTGFPSDMNEGR